MWQQVLRAEPGQYWPLEVWGREGWGVEAEERVEEGQAGARAQVVVEKAAASDCFLPSQGGPVGLHILCACL
jgi:hypothetical protein